MARHDQSAPATKADIAAIMESIGRLHDANERWKDEILHATKRWKEDIIHHFDVALENAAHNLGGIFKDRTQQHHDDLGDLKRRVRAIESHLGLVA